MVSTSILRALASSVTEPEASACRSRRSTSASIEAADACPHWYWLSRVAANWTWAGANPGELIRQRRKCSAAFGSWRGSRWRTCTSPSTKCPRVWAEGKPPASGSEPVAALALI